MDTECEDPVLVGVASLNSTLQSIQVENEFERTVLDFANVTLQLLTRINDTLHNAQRHAQTAETYSHIRGLSNATSNDITSNIFHRDTQHSRDQFSTSRLALNKSTSLPLDERTYDSTPFEESPEGSPRKYRSSTSSNYLASNGQVNGERSYEKIESCYSNCLTAGSDVQQTPNATPKSKKKVSRRSTVKRASTQSTVKPRIRVSSDSNSVRIVKSAPCDMHTRNTELCARIALSNIQHYSHDMRIRPIDHVNNFTFQPMGWSSRPASFRRSRSVGRTCSDRTVVRDTHNISLHLLDDDRIQILVTNNSSISDDSGLPTSFRTKKSTKKSENGKKALTRTKALPSPEKDRNFKEVKYTERAPSRESNVSKIDPVWIDPRTNTIKGTWVDPNPRRMSNASSINNNLMGVRRMSNASSIGSVTTRGRRRTASKVSIVPVHPPVKRDSYLFATYSYDD